ncbi:MAG: hypothetical protein ACXW4E_00410 [Anaerolineales bacterium]
MHKQTPAGPQHDTDPDALQRALHLLLEQISKRDQKISWITAQKEVEVAEKDALDALLRSTQALLREREAQLHEILTSRTWKMAVVIQRVRNLLVPLHSRREAILQQVFRIVLSPFKKLRKS